MGIQSSGRKRRNGLAAFRAVEAEVRSGLDAGRTLVAIYEERREQLGISYAQFARYAQRLRNTARSGALLAGGSYKAPSKTSAPSQPTGPTELGTGPPKGRPEDAVPTLDMDGFATRALKDEDLF